MSDKKYYLGIDGGGSKTAFAVIDEDNRVIYYNKQGAGALDTVSLEQLKQVFINGVKDIKVPIYSVFAGIGGISSEEQRQQVIAIIKTLPICNEKTKIDANNDAYNALFGSLGGKDGIVLIAGTGSVCLGKKGYKYVRVGGYCYQEGDAGSAYDIGMNALKYLARVIDHRFEPSDFSLALSKAIECYDYETLTAFFVNASRTEIAVLAKIVTQYSDNEYAKKIIENAVAESLLMIKTAFKQLDIDEYVSFSIIGSLGNADTLYKQLLIEKLTDISDRIVFKEKEYEAYIGSALKAKEVK